MQNISARSLIIWSEYPYGPSEAMDGPTTSAKAGGATPLAAQAQFAAGGKRTPKKSLGMIMATYGNIYVAQTAFGANPAQTVKAFAEAEAYNGPSLVIAY